MVLDNSGDIFYSMISTILHMMVICLESLLGKISLSILQFWNIIGNSHCTSGVRIVTLQQLPSLWKVQHVKLFPSHTQVTNPKKIVVIIIKTFPIIVHNISKFQFSCIQFNIFSLQFFFAILQK